MTRHEITTKVNDHEQNRKYYMDITNLPLVGDTPYGDAEFAWDPDASPYEMHAIVMHSLPSEAIITFHEINIVGFEPGEDTEENFFRVSNCYYLDIRNRHHQYLSNEAFDSPVLAQKYWHQFPDGNQEVDGSRFRVVGYNTHNYEEVSYKAPYISDCMHYQYHSLDVRARLDGAESSPRFSLVFNVCGRNALPRPLIFTSRIEWFV